MCVKLGAVQEILDHRNICLIVRVATKKKKNPLWLKHMASVDLFWNAWNMKYLMWNCIYYHYSLW